MEGLRKEIAKYKGNEDVLNAICQIYNVAKCEIDDEGNVWVNDSTLNEEQLIFVWGHPLMNQSN